MSVTFDKKMWILVYDLAEGWRGRTKHSQDIENLRWRVWYDLRFKYKCIPIQESLWEIRNESKVDELKNSCEEWRNLFEKYGARVKLQIGKIGTNKQLYNTFKEMELDLLDQWIGQILETCKKYDQKSKILKKNVKFLRRKTELVNLILDEDFKDNERYSELVDKIMIVFDKLIELEGRAV